MACRQTGHISKTWSCSYFITQQQKLLNNQCCCSVGGLPIGAVLLKQKIADVMSPGDHGSTFAGNPLVCAAGEAVLDVLLAPGFLQQVHDNGVALRHGLREKLGSNPHVKEVRGLGLISGIQLDVVSLILNISRHLSSSFCCMLASKAGQQAPCEGALRASARIRHPA